MAVSVAKPELESQGAAVPTVWTDFPEEWRIVSLGELAKIKYGKAKPKKPGNIPVIGSGGVYAYTGLHLVDFPTIVIGRKGTAGMAWLQEQPCWPSDTTFYLVWATDSTDYRYIHHCFQLRPLSGEHAKTTLPSLQKPDLENYAIALPPLAEQRAIAQVLRSVQEAKRATEKVIAATRQLKQSLMRHLFTYGPVRIDEAGRVELKETEVGAIPKHWNVLRLGKVARIGNGSTPKRTNSAYWLGGTIPWLTSGKVYERIIRHADEFVTEQARTECHLPLVKQNSVVVAITGQGKTLGNAALVSFDTCVSQHLAYMQFETNEVVPEYVLSFLQSQYTHFRQVSSGGGSTKGALTCAFLKTYPLALPPLEEQQMIARALHATEAKLKAEQARKTALDALFQTLLHQLMTGRIRVGRT